MNEILNPQPEEQRTIIKLEVSQIFKPFEAMKEFPATEINHETTQEIITIGLHFKGIDGRLNVLTTPNAEDLNSPVVTPLGPARTVITFENDSIKIEELPLRLQLCFDIDDIKQFHELQKYSMEFTLGEKRYYLSCSGIEPRRIVENSLKKEGQQELYDYEMKTEGNKIENVLLPYNITKLSQIEARIVEKEMFLV